MKLLFLAPCLAVCALSATAAPAWPELRQVVKQLQSEDGTTRLFKDNPQLGQAYATPADFENMIRIWRGRVPALPSTPEDLDPAVGTVETHPQFGKTVVFFTFQNEENNGGLTFLKLIYEGSALEKVLFFRGFLRTVPSAQPWERRGTYGYQNTSRY